ncbi:MAG: formylglycine-generating enzyme family protein, partial [Planctomyces sp.]
YPVTNEQYGRYLQEKSGQVQPPEFWGNRKFNEPKQPVVGINWHDAVAYCEWAKSRLPTEAEWEYCCRAGNEGDYCFGDATFLLRHYAWYFNNSGRSTHPVGEKLPNQWGLHDMHGNVWEWCQDWYEGYDLKPQQDHSGPAQGRGRVLRGGSWFSVSVSCAAWYRSCNSPENRYVDVGFRLARTLPPDP